MFPLVFSLDWLDPCMVLAWHHLTHINKVRLQSLSFRQCKGLRTWYTVNAKLVVEIVISPIFSSLGVSYFYIFGLGSTFIMTPVIQLKVHHDEWLKFIAVVTLHLVPERGQFRAVSFRFSNEILIKLGFFSSDIYFKN